MQGSDGTVDSEAESFPIRFLQCNRYSIAWQDLSGDSMSVLASVNEWVG